MLRRPVSPISDSIVGDMADAEHHNVIGFIASTVEKLRDDVLTIREEMATKEDLARLEGRFDEKLAHVDTKFTENLIGVEGRFTEKLALAENQFTEKLARAENQFSEKLAQFENQFIWRLARFEGQFNERLDASITGIRGDIEQIHLRLDTLGHSISSRFEHIEGELSRLRGAVYLLGKDHPDVLRLLGQREN